jgi:hypothetical protein
VSRSVIRITRSGRMFLQGCVSYFEDFRHPAERRVDYRVVMVGALSR